MASPSKIPTNSNFMLLSKLFPLNHRSLLSSQQLNIVYIGSKSCLRRSQKNSFCTPPSSTPNSPSNSTLKGFLKLISSLIRESRVFSIIQSLRMRRFKKVNLEGSTCPKRFATMLVNNSLSTSCDIQDLLSKNKISFLD